MLSVVDLLNAPYFSQLRQRLDFLTDRQKLIAENIANANTPGFNPRDLDAQAFETAMERQARRGESKTIAARVVTRPDSETTLDGNAVVLEEQTLRAGETRAAFELGLTLYRKGLDLMRLAARPPGR
jgi:flagellar basal-body rod protein FlgB